jgi:hypothetical protein
MKEFLAKLAVMMCAVGAACGFTSSPSIHSNSPAAGGPSQGTGVKGMQLWPFKDPENTTTFTVRQIMDGSAPILLVCRDADDGSWQFLTGDAFDMKSAMLVTLKQTFSRDSSIAEIADLPPGWCASREREGAPWRRHHA